VARAYRLRRCIRLQGFHTTFQGCERSGPRASSSLSRGFEFAEVDIEAEWHGLAQRNFKLAGERLQPVTQRGGRLPGFIGDGPCEPREDLGERVEHTYRARQIGQALMAALAGIGDCNQVREDPFTVGEREHQHVVRVPPVRLR
jgi:hypothetical protein